MSSAVSSERWQEAQRAEREYWKWPVVDAREISRIVLGLSEAAVWAKERLPPDVRDSEWVELGIGPLGLGCGHFIAGAGSHRLVGVDPLPLIPKEQLLLPPPLIALIESCRLACDTFSLLSQARFTAVTKLRQKDSWLVRAHPFRFRFGQLLGLLKHAQFRVVAHEPDRGLLLHELARGSYRSLVLAKPT